ncbi:MAG: hypothetical protein M1281_19530 [Chloroflexi bacterium]|nr:hypothetical protein [Chloroflexota bacterium]
MKSIARDITLAISRVDRRTIQMVVIILSLAMFLLTAGAPASDGGFGG